MKRKSASKKLLPLMLILMLILGISMPANAAANPRLNSTKKVLYVGKTSQLKVVNWKKAVKWSSSNNKVVKVSSKGKITAVKTGTATVKARIAKKTLTCKVTVKSPGMSVKKAVLYVKGKSLQLKVNGVSGKTVWSSANKKIVKVSSKGKITAVKTGTTVVKAKIGKKVYTCKVTVKNPYLSAKSLKFVWGTVNTSRKLSIKGDVIKAASSSNTKVAKVKKDGTVSVTGTGKCTVTFKDSKKRTYRCKITVVKPTLKNQKATLEEGESIQLGFKEKGVKVSWSSADQKIATVTKTGVVQAVGEGNTSIVAKVKGIKIFARIFVTKKYVQDSGHEYTRGEWVKLLLDKVGCKYEEQFDSKNYYYADTRENENGIAAEIAKTMGIIPDETDEQDVPYFYPDEYATREFAAYTAVMLMGYETTDEEPTCTDAAQIRYKNVVAIALKKNMLSLNGDTFEPEKAINGNDAAQILKAIDQITEDSVIDENYDSKVTYATNVVEVKDTSKNIYNVVQNSDGTYTITVKDGNAYKNLETGKVVLFSAKEMGTDTDIALKVQNITKDGQGRLIIKAGKPDDISEVYKSIDFEGAGIADPENMQVTAEGVQYEYIPENSSEVPAGGLTLGGSIPVPGKLKFDLNHKFNDKVKLSGSVAVTIPDVSCKLDAGFSWGKIEVRHFIASVTGKADFEGGLYISGVNSEQQIKHASGTMETVSDVLELGRVPIKLGTTGLSADLVVSLFYDVSGQFVVKYSVEAIGGYEFKDGNGRFIHDFSQTLTPVTIEGSAKCGLQFGLNLTALETWDLAGIDIKVGPAAKASVSYTVRDAGNVLCSDVRTYIYAAGELNPDTVVGKFLKTVWHYTLSKDFLSDDDDNPLKLKVHFENGTLVDKCTVGAGSIEGSVLDSNSKAPVKNASVEAYSGTVKVEKTFTKEDGTYSFNDLDEGTYKIVVTATGYQKYESSSMEVSANQITYAESFLMVSRAEAGDGELSGRFIHSMTGGNIENVTYELRKGWDNVIGETVKEGVSADGTYTLNVPAGNYTLNASNEDFVSAHINVVVQANACSERDVTMSPTNISAGDEGLLQIVLTWGETPRDLDSHLLGPADENGDDYFHVYYRDKNAYSEDGDVIANLDLDDTSSYGPETTTIYKGFTGRKYSFYVYDYTNGEDDASTELSASSAKVTVYRGGKQIYQANVPVNREGYLWHVFDYDVQSNKLMPVNTFVYDYEVPEANAMEDSSGIISETEALEIIRNSEKKAEEESSEELNMSSEEGKTDDNTEEEIFDDSSEEPEISESGDTAEVIEFPKDSETEEENDGTEITEEDSESAEELPVEDIYEESEELGLAG